MHEDSDPIVSLRCPRLSMDIDLIRTVSLDISHRKDAALLVVGVKTDRSTGSRPLVHADRSMNGYQSGIVCRQTTSQAGRQDYGNQSAKTER